MQFGYCMQLQGRYCEATPSHQLGIIGVFVVEQPAEMVAHVAETLDGDRPAFQGGRAEDLLGACPHPLHDA